MKVTESFFVSTNNSWLFGVMVTTPNFGSNTRFFLVIGKKKII